MAWEIETVYGLSDADLFSEMDTIGWNDFLFPVVDPADPDYAQYLDNIASYTVPGGSTEFAEIQFDQSVDPAPTWEGTKINFFKYVEDTHLAEYSAMEIARVLRSLEADTADYIENGKDWRTFTVMAPDNKPTWQQMKSEWAVLQAADSVKTTVVDAYKTMSDNIAAEVYNTFGTSDENSANAFAQSWRIKAERGADYASEGLVAMEAIAGFSINDPLDTAQKVTDYYSAKVDLLIVFDKFRDAEIMTYLVAKAAAEA